MDKFNRHRDQNVHTIENVVGYSYKSIFNVFGAHTDVRGNYAFFKDEWSWRSKTDTSKVFEVPITEATIKAAHWVPNSATIYINNNKYEAFDSCAGVVIKKGDKIRATYQPNSKKLFLLELIVEFHIKPRT